MTQTHFDNGWTRRIQAGLALPLVAVFLSACIGQKAIVPPKPAWNYGHSLVEYPYNTDASGRDFPLEIGRFSVPISATDPNSSIELAYVKYRSRSELELPAIVFVELEANKKTFSSALYYALSSDRDVLVLDARGRGLSSPLSRCPRQLPIPFDQPLSITGLVSSIASVSPDCNVSLQRSVPRDAYSVGAIANDLKSLADVLGLESFIFAAGGLQSDTALDIASNAWQLVSGIVLLEPLLTDSIVDDDIYDYFAKSSADGEDLTRASHVRLMRQLRSQLAISPIETVMERGESQAVPLVIGPTDLDFMLAYALRSAETDFGDLFRAIADSHDGNHRLLAKLTVDTRLRLSELDKVKLLTARTYRAERASDEQGLAMAIRWPESGIERCDCSVAQPSEVDRKQLFRNAPTLLLMSRSSLSSHLFDVSAVPELKKHAVVMSSDVSPTAKLSDSQAQSVAETVRVFIGNRVTE